MKIKLLAFILSFFLLTCQYNQEYHSVNHNNEFQISIPGWIKKEKLAEEAVLSYANRYRNFYFVVLTHDKKIPLDTINSRAFYRINHVLDSAETTQDTAVINNLHATHFSINGKMGDEKEKIFYELYVVNGNKRYYEICIWTRGQERHKKYLEDFYTIIHSFKEI